MIEQPELQQHRLIGQFSDGSLGDRVIGVVEHPEPNEPFSHALVMDTAIKGEFQGIGYGNTRLAAFQTAYGALEGEDRYEAWREHQREEAIHLVADAVDPHKNGERQIQGVVLEGPPIYLYPRADHPTENIGGTTAREGWQVLDQIGETIGDDKTLHFAMVDDFNGRPESVLYIDSSAELERLTVEAGLNNLHIFQRREGPNGVGLDQVFSETGFVTDPDDENKSSCSILDSGFQMKKIESQLSPDMSLVDVKAALERTLLVVVHPTTFRKQQVAMLSAVLGAMKDHPLFKAIPKQDRMSLLSSMYIHVWVDETGDVVGVTKPRWNKELGKFEHIEVNHEENEYEN